jgi:hypothetical protein
MFARAFLFCSIAAVAVAQSGSPDPSAIFEKLFQAVRDNYPMPEYPGFRAAEWFQEFKPRIAAAPTPAAAFELMDEYVCRLNDYHSGLVWPNRPERVSPAIEVTPVLTGPAPAGYGIWGRMRPPIELPALDGLAIGISRSGEGAADLKPGDEIVAVAGAPVRELLAQSWRHCVGSSVAGKLTCAARRMLTGPRDSEIKLTLRDGRSVALSRSAQPKAGPPIALREVDGVPVIRIANWMNDRILSTFDGYLEDLRRRPGVIIDVRHNGGGSDEMAASAAARFLASPIIGSISFRRTVPSQAFERTVETIAPRGPWRYEGRVAILADEGCMSACEHFVSDGRSRCADRRHAH